MNSGDLINRVDELTAEVEDLEARNRIQEDLITDLHAQIEVWTTAPIDVSVASVLAFSAGIEGSPTLTYDIHSGPAIVFTFQSYAMTIHAEYANSVTEQHWHIPITDSWFSVGHRLRIGATCNTTHVVKETTTGLQQQDNNTIHVDKSIFWETEDGNFGLMFYANDIKAYVINYHVNHSANEYWMWLTPLESSRVTTRMLMLKMPTEEEEEYDYEEEEFISLA